MRRGWWVGVGCTTMGGPGARDVGCYATKLDVLNMSGDCEIFLYICSQPLARDEASEHGGVMFMHS